jgi:hemerythrin-like domain-containing protein
MGINDDRHGIDLESPVKSVEVLMAEHRVIERVLTALEVATERLDQGGNVNPGFFIHATDFIRGFADGCHHQKEEGVLFKAMAQAGMPTEEGPIAVMLAEHEQARAYTADLLKAAQRLQAGDEQAAAAVIHNARGYAALLRQHIAKEDGVLFPMADSVISATQHTEVAADFQRIERENAAEGVHDMYLALAEKLERLARGMSAQDGHREASPP